MFDFVKNIDYTLIRIITDVENNIKVRNGYTMVAIQSYCEMLLKYINSKENIIKSSKLSLGDFLNNDTFMMIIEKLQIVILLMQKVRFQFVIMMINLFQLKQLLLVFHTAKMLITTRFLMILK